MTPDTSLIRDVLRAIANKEMARGHTKSFLPNSFMFPYKNFVLKIILLCLHYYVKIILNKKKIFVVTKYCLKIITGQKSNERFSIHNCWYNVAYGLLLFQINYPKITLFTFFSTVIIQI